MIVQFLIWIGLTRRLDNGKLFVPFHVPPMHTFKKWSYFKGHCLFHGPFYVFRNLPGVIDRLPGRVLPRRWGFGVYGFEFGDRGG